MSANREKSGFCRSVRSNLPLGLVSPVIALLVRYQDRLRATLQVTINDQDGAVVISDYRDRSRAAKTGHGFG